VAVEKGQALAMNPAESGQSRLLTINVPKRLVKSIGEDDRVPDRRPRALCFNDFLAPEGFTPRAPETT